MDQFYVSQPQIDGGVLKVEGDEVKHIRKVLRLGKGDEIRVFDGSGNEYEGAIVEAGPFSVSIRVHQILSCRKEPVLEVTLAQHQARNPKSQTNPKTQ